MLCLSVSIHTQFQRNESTTTDQFHQSETFRHRKATRCLEINKLGEQMKKQILVASTMLSLVVTVMVTRVSAQSSDYFRVTIPFEFAISGKTLPAGEYIVRRVSSDSPQWLSITSVNPGTRQNVLTHKIRSGTLQSESKLVFRRYGDQYFLSQIWEAGDNDGHELLTSRREAGLQRLMAKNTAKPEMVVVSGRRTRQ